MELVSLMAICAGCFSIPIVGAIYLLSGVAEVYSQEAERCAGHRLPSAGFSAGPKVSLRVICLVYIVMVTAGIWGMLQPDRYLQIFGIAVQAYAILIGFTAIAFTMAVINRWKARIIAAQEGRPVSPSAFFPGIMG